MHPNAKLIESFYTSFQNLDAAGMKKCYHPDVQFSDPAFPNLKGDQAGAMWTMLIGNLRKGSQPWKLDFSNIQASDTDGSCHWEAHYTLSSTGKKVHNIIEAKFRFKNDLIIIHTDTFNFYRWARMGFGFTGILMGWTPFFRKKVQARVKNLLDSFIAKRQG
jgi:hypothetical protein